MFKKLIDSILGSACSWTFVIIYIVLTDGDDWYRDLSDEVRKIMHGGRMRINPIKDGKSQQVINLVKTDFMREEILKYIPIKSRMLEAQRIMTMNGFSCNGSSEGEVILSCRTFSTIRSTVWEIKIKQDMSLKDLRLVGEIEVSGNYYKRIHSISG